MPRWLFALVQFFPLSLFASYAFWYGAPDEARWREAFQLASLAALLQLAIVLPQCRPASRLVLAVNFYLLLGGIAFMAHQWWFLQLYDVLRESAIFISMLVVGVVTTIGSPAGFIASQVAPRAAIIRASGLLLAATAVGLIMSVVFRGDRYLAAVFPIVALAILQRVLMHRLNRKYAH
jgi:hypothetical protein